MSATLAANQKAVSLDQASFSPGSLALAALDTAGRTVDGIESVIDTTGKFTTELAAYVPNAAVSVLLPEAVAKPAHSIINGAAGVSNFIGTVAAKGALHGLTFGAPAWLQAARQYVAVKGATEHLKFNAHARSTETAERLISRVENYYKDKVGSFAGTISLPNDVARLKLKEQVSGRLNNMLTQGMAPEEMAKELKAITSDLMSAFQVHRLGMKAALFTGLGVANATGVLPKLIEYVGTTVSATAGKMMNAAYEWGTRVLGEVWMKAITAAKDLVVDIAKAAGQAVWETVKFPFKAGWDLFKSGSTKIGEVLNFVTPDVPSPIIPHELPTVGEVAGKVVEKVVPKPLQAIQLPDISNSIPAELSLPSAPTLPTFAPPLPSLTDSMAQQANNSLGSYVAPVQAESPGFLSSVGSVVSGPIDAVRSAGASVGRGVSGVQSVISGVKSLFSLGRW